MYTKCKHWISEHRLLLIVTAIIIQAGFSVNSSNKAIEQLATSKERADKIESRLSGLEAKLIYGDKK